MAQPDFIATPTLRVTAPKPKMTVYYGLLIIALMCILIACLFLYLEVRRFGGFGTVPQRIAAIDTIQQMYLFTTGDTEKDEMTNDQIPMANEYLLS